MKSRLSNATLFIGDDFKGDVRHGQIETDFKQARTVDCQYWGRVEHLYNGRDCELRDDANNAIFKGVIEGQRKTEGAGKVTVTRFVVRLVSGGTFKGGRTGESDGTW